MLKSPYDRSAIVISYVWEAIPLPFHSRRIALLRVKSRHACYQVKMEMEEDLALLQAAIATARRMEDELARSDLAFEPTRRAAVVAFRAALTRLRLRIRHDFASHPRPDADIPDNLPPAPGSNHNTPPQ